MVYGFIVPIPAIATPRNSSQWGFVSVPREWPLIQVLYIEFFSRYII